MTAMYTEAKFSAIPVPSSDHAVPEITHDQEDSAAFFKDNLEHLQALEQEAQLWLATTFFRNASSFSSAGESFVMPHFNIQSLPKDKLSHAVLSEHLSQVAVTNRLKEARSARKNSALNFEQLCSTYNLDPFERMAILILFANYSSIDFRKLYNECEFDRYDSKDGEIKVGTLLSLLSSNFREQIQNRRYFSIRGTLIREELLVVKTYIDNATNILDVNVILHERIARYILGDDNTYDMTLQYIVKERPTVSLDRVVLPERIKEDVLSMVENYTRQTARRGELGLRQFYGYGTGLVLLFTGPSGTGKTMLAHGLAAKLGKELLSLSMGTIEQSNTSFEDAIKHVFKEARLADAMVFFDECDDVLKNNSSDSRDFLIEIEKSECIVILATNRATELDPALERRITMHVKFAIPDVQEREKIWQALVPEHVCVANDVDFKTLARQYIFTGGLIKNALFMAINSALKHDGSGSVRISAEEIEEAALYQAESMFAPGDFCTIYKPEVSIGELAIPEYQKQELLACARIAGTLNDHKTGLCIIIGTADVKTGIDCAEALAQEAGLHVRRFDFSHIMMGPKADKIKDPLTQREISVFDYAFQASTGCRAVTMFVDQEAGFSHFLLDQQKEGQKGDIIGLRTRLREFSEILIIITAPIHRKYLPPEFHYYLEPGCPPPELQVARWMQHLNEAFCPEDTIARLVHTHPLHLHEIDFMVQQAFIQATINGRAGNITEEDMWAVISRFKKKAVTPVLFGQRTIVEKQ